MASITLEIELDETFLYDVLTTIVESGSINYWARYSEINREVDTHNVISFTIEDNEWHNEHSHECDPGCDSPEFKHEEFDIDHVVLGIQRILGAAHGEERVECAKYIHDYIMRGVREGDAGDIDAEACDVIAQAAVFGQLVYG